MQDTVENLISDLEKKKENIRNLEDVFVYYTKGEREIAFDR